MNKDLYGKILAANYSDADSECGSGLLDGYPIGCTTVNELIDVLKALPEDFRVTCCGAENFIYIFPGHCYITIDNAQNLDC